MALLASPLVNRVSFVPAGLRSGAAFVAALACAGTLAQFTNAPPILIALFASLVVAGMLFLLAAQNPFDADYSTLAELGTHVIDSVVATVGLWAIAKGLPAVGSFVCESLVPWELSVAIFGAFGMSWLSSASKIRAPEVRVGLAIQVGFFWIAPFYGFFHAPWFLAQTIALPCESRPLPQAIIVVFGMAVAAVAGRRAAAWMFV